MRESTLLRIIDDATAAARMRAGDAIVCSAGCGDCCHRMFAITQADAARLARGLSELHGTDPARAAEIRERAGAAWNRVKFEFPGDIETGILTGNEEWRGWFWARAGRLPCPVQDPATQTCSMYEHRPAACRLYGPLIHIGGDSSGPCPKCYPGLSPEQIEHLAVRLEVDPGECAAPGPETVIAAAIALVLPTRTESLVSSVKNGYH